ncbi:MAG: exodeoxyribonuclease V subunit gamma [Chloroflexi bacterium]|nr:exodeoxyribonuclease V subunit gamma [Chloroflexota bacterium]
MPANLYLAPVGADKTATVVDGLLDAIHIQRRTLPKVWVLTANRRQEMSFRGRLTDQGDAGSTIFNIEYFSFYTLNERLLNLAARPARKITGQTQLALLRSLTGRINAEGELRYFDRISSTHGFIEIVADLINELKQNGVDVQQFARAASSDKDRDIAAIYQQYQNLLKESKLVDIEGEGWLAQATLRQKPDIVGDVDLVIVDGFDQYTPVQARLLGELARTVPRIDITLTTLPEKAGMFSRRGQLTRSRLEDAHKKAGASLRITTLSTPGSDRHADLAQLGEVIFQAKPASSGGGAIRLIAMPSEAEETRAVLRAVKEHLLQGVRAGDIMIALRDWDRYAPYFRGGQDEYDLPLLLHNQPLLHTIPVIAVLIDLLDLAPHFRRADLLDILRSPYIDSGLSAADIDLLDRISREQLFLRGTQHHWIDMITLAADHPGNDDDEAAVAVSREQAADLACKLARFLAGITPPASADVNQYVDWLERLINRHTDLEDQVSNAEGTFSLEISERITDGLRPTDAIVQRDTEALRSLSHILHDLLVSAHILHSGLGAPSEIEWTRFWSDLKYALGNSSGRSSDAARDGRVLVTTATEARGLPHEHVYIMGLAEGLFPAETPDDPIYLDSEREHLQSKGIQLATQAERVDDRGLFVELISLPRQSLTLSRPTFKDGKVWLESYLWRSLMQAFPNLPVETAAVGQVVPMNKAASGPELMLAMADQLPIDQAGGADTALTGGTWLDGHPEQARLWRHIRRGQRVELRRLSTSPYDQYSGQITRPILRSETKKRLGASRVWSASQLKDYGLCGFRFFAKRLLKLDDLKEPERGYDSRQLGLLNHKILEDSYRHFGEIGLAIHADNLERALEAFERIALERLDSAPQDFGFLAGASWQAEKAMLFKRLGALIKLDFSPESPLNRIAGDRRIYGVEHRFERAEIDLPELDEKLRLRGTIDRIDVVNGQLILLDYKTGATPIDRSEMDAGRDFQMMTYVSALEAELNNAINPPQIKRGVFWHLRNLKTSGEIDLDKDEDAEAIAAARSRVAEHLHDGRNGRFPAHPTKFENGKCARYCEYAHLCRVNVTNRYKKPKF